MNTIKRLFLLLLCVSLQLAALAQSVPKLVSYQGRLTDAGGQPLPDGTYTLAIRIWTKKTPAEAGDTLVWGQESQVAAQKGVFNVILGSGQELTGSLTNDVSAAFNDPERYIGLTVIKGAGGAAVPNPQELLPRLQVLSTPYAIRAATAGTVLDGAITIQKLATGSVGSEQLANGIVKAVHLAEGAAPFVPHRIQVFESSGVWVKPVGISNVYVKVIGRGGDGGSTGGDSRPHPGGGGGGYAEGYLSVTGDVAVVIGEVNSFATIQATAGGNANGFLGGAGGMGSGGQINLPGGAGQSGSIGAVNAPGGMGGGTAMGAGGAGGGFLPNNDWTNGGSGGKYGGGGGGGTNVGIGGKGDPGAVIVYY